MERTRGERETRREKRRREGSREEEIER